MNHAEDEWTARLAELADELPVAESEDEQFVLLGSLVALLDTHSWIEPAHESRAYPVWLYRFPEGWFVVGAEDESLIGTRLVSINGHSAEGLERQFRGLVAHDNDSGALDSMQSLFSFVAWLHGAGVVDDVAEPNYLLETADGDLLRPQLKPMSITAWESGLGIVGGLIGNAPEAVARRTERIWTRLDVQRHVMLVAANDYGDMTDAMSEISAAIRDGSADRVVLDMRYLRGGSGDFRLVELLSDDPLIDRRGGLTVLIGRENVSAATNVAHWLDTRSAAKFVGEQTPARADGFRCECLEIRLPYSDHLVVIPTWVDHNGDNRRSIPPDVPMELKAADFFAGQDPVLDAALDDTLPPPSF